MSKETTLAARKIIQFDWRRHWRRKVAPHLNKEVVQVSLDVGMMMLDPKWKRGDPPYLLGDTPPHRTRVMPGKLSWYRPWRQCHGIAFFSMAIGVLNDPHLDWNFLSGDLHTVPVGSGRDGQQVVMDILLFDSMTAEESIELATKKVDHAPACNGWDEVFEAFVSNMVPIIRDAACHVRQEPLTVAEPPERKVDREKYRT